MSNPKVVITGAPRDPTGPQGNIAPRLEINDFIKNEKYFSLYVQALSSMFAEETDPRVSFFSIGGIHGRPYIDWNQSPADGSGYCVHATSIFVTWHRPYVALFEQKIHDYATAIAKTYGADRAEWEGAAASLRQPYWDWAVNLTPPDQIISDKEVTITLPTGKKSVPNPFFEYRFRGTEASDSFLRPFSQIPQTVRWPNNTTPQAQTNVDTLKGALGQTWLRDQVRTNTNRLFSITDWAGFSNKTVSEGGGANSVETIHDTIHSWTGGGGHFGAVPYSGFDPIFYLHHCAVDRLVSLWSKIHGVWVPGAPASRDLTPFWRDQTTYWNSTEIISTDTSLNYTYPELLNGATPAEVGQAVAKLYGGAPALTSPAFRIQLAQTPQPAVNPQGTPRVTEWTVEIRCKQYECGGSFSVLLFLGDIPDDPTERLASCIGSFDAFVNENPEECSNCQDRLDDTIQGFVHITSAIARRYNPGTYDPDNIAPLLTRDLKWRVQKIDGTVVQLPSLEVRVMTADLDLPLGASFPTIGAPVYHDGITRGREGGSRA